MLVACEYSGTVRDAFIKKGHDAMSCDILPTESPGPHHQGDVMDVINNGWDLMIGHPPCDYLSYAGTAHWNNPGRVYKRLEALRFFADLWEAPIEKICLENPKSCASPVIAKYSQEIQPFYFGHDVFKTTWLWLKNLPNLTYSKPDLFGGQTKETPEPIYKLKNGQNVHWCDAHGGGNANRAKDRAKFWPLVAEAMAEQWG